jgi:hypothetical protein
LRAITITESPGRSGMRPPAVEARPVG